MSHPKSLLTDASIDALVRLRELLPGTTDRELIEAALVEMVANVTQANELRGSVTDSAKEVV